jgi:stage II sporulation protein AB (anti-sigma F factor)
VASAANYFRLEMAAVPENVGLARLAVATFAANLDFSVPEVEELKVAVSEAVSNAVIHAYPTEPGRVVVQCRAVAGGVLVEVADEGIGIEDLDEARKPSVSSDPERMGLGFVFMESFSDEFHVESAPGKGTRVRMLKRVAEAGRATGAS